MSTLKHITERNWFPIIGRVPIYAEHLNKVIDAVNAIGSSEVGDPADLVPVFRTNNPAVAADSVYKNLDHLDATVGADNTPVSRTNNPTVANTTLNAKVQALDNAIGGNLTPVVRTNNPTVSNTTAVAKIAALDAAIGVTPTSVTTIAAADSVNVNLSALDLAFYNHTTFGSLSASINGAGANQGAATAIASGIVVVGSADGAVGVILPAVAVGKTVTIYNVTAAQDLKVYPATGEYINAAAQNASVKFSHATDVSSVVCTRASAAHWTMTAIHATIS